MRVIMTKFIWGTNTKPDRIKASSGRHLPSQTKPWDNDLGAENVHIEAAKAFANSYGWDTNFITGEVESGVCVHVFVPKDKVMIDKLEYEILKITSDSPSIK